MGLSVERAQILVPWSRPRARRKARRNSWYFLFIGLSLGLVLEFWTESDEVRSPDGEERRGKLLVATDRGATKPAAARTSPTMGGIRGHALRRVDDGGAATTQGLLGCPLPA